MTRPSYDPMRPAAPPFPGRRLSRVLDEARVAELTAAYGQLDYDARVRFSRRVTSAPDQGLAAIADTLTAQPVEPPQPLPATAPDAPAVNQAAAQAAPVLPVPVEQLPDLHKEQLQQIAGDAGLPKTGVKAELVDRITAAVQPPAAPEVPTSAPEEPAEPAAQPETPAAAPQADSGPQEAPAAPAAPADGTPTEGGQPA